MAVLKRTIRTIDAAGKAPGRLATQIAMILIGKDKASFLPNVDAGDAVEVANASKMKITGKKLEQKTYYAHTGGPRGLSAKLMKTVWAKDPSDVLRRAVDRMLPKNRHRTERMKRLKITN
ncbi:50S ribosomal protein L13 [Candidatus Uhrbacteria bacterium RIFOXYB12_FULL_58_10]|uniref:Large ribosomal subunit protein uL13 n=1 Tax=Candidatus Uhrbacteria bacterium RIFOXYB2_FULL_57_15 TaxID=1802422 RepID=A0A1F7W6S7_9BACT|nr:MAG: 50S ribosomal protein L13 [Candidatus Uhrbacteria bacterium RIFOXYB12_FULL_58_10]OGL98501.1 MAG: 50S ribosomal protein L13 [Candidatus Uhrbacteria bacterium RIFOXYB2_FULL_57_15]OGL99184.1 MAG: 50S ribosomal protein L13 [Candidatus Uhrbacteria bacterium RIFOXYC12_FULL_57_11]